MHVVATASSDAVQPCGMSATWASSFAVLCPPKKVSEGQALLIFLSARKGLKGGCSSYIASFIFSIGWI